MAKLSSVTADLRLLDPFWHEPVERTVLPNGLTLILKPDRSAALSSVQVWVKTGSNHEGAHLGAGLSHYLEHMLFKGTTRRAGREISATVQAHGGYINAYTTFDRTVYYIDLPSEHTAVAIDLLADAVLHSTMPPDECAKEKEVILREIAMTKDDPDNRLWDSLFATAFREHPYRQPIIGHRDVFSTVTRDDLVGYYQARYVPNNLVVVIVGDIDVATIRAAVELHFGATPRAQQWANSLAGTFALYRRGFCGLSDRAQSHVQSSPAGLLPRHPARRIAHLGSLRFAASCPSDQSLHQRHQKTKSVTYVLAS